MFLKPFSCILICSIFLISSCDSNDDDGGINCTLEHVYGLNITLKNIETEEIITENITVIATDTNYEEELMVSPENTTFVGAGERAGTYIITVNSNDFETFISEPIILTSDECHVIPQAHTFYLVPN